MGRRPIHTTPSTQRHHTPSANESEHAIRAGTARTVAHRRKTTGWLTLLTWQEGKSLTWDVIVTDTVADSYLHLTSAKAGGAAENAATRKEDKYVDLQQTYTLIPLAFETLGPINVNGVEFLQELGHRLQPSATTTVTLYACSSESPSCCSGSMLSRSLTHLRKLLSYRQCSNDSAGTEDTLSFPLSVCVRFEFRSIFSVLILFY